MVSSYNTGLIASMVRTAEIFGVNLKNLRKELRLSQADIAQTLGVSAPTVSQWETGKYLPDSDIIDRLIEYLGTTPMDMFRVQSAANPRRQMSLPEALQVISENWPELAIRKRKPTG